MKTPLSELFVLRARKAFTMMEVMTAMAIIAVVSSIVLPGAANFYSSERVKAVAEVVVQNIRMGKYKAMQEQALHRMIFSPGGDTYKVQIHTGYFEGNTPPDISTGVTEEDYDSINWESVLDNEEIEIDPGVTVTREAYLAPRVIYFWPDGYLVTHDAAGISETNKKLLPECFILFEYGSSRIRVYLNAMGVLSSESYAVDDDAVNGEDVLW
ncbi:MAG: prepilin-type N-terminal cleavage/methylation domain-containing protein [Candidatus Riflebacteria bacterium]|nr:prepilin-type N-terminal cleavage/methylation domain-containing protein [Candidatus Riflebacteria bacterium]